MSGLKLKRKNVTAFDRQPNKKERRERHIEAMLAPLKRRIAKMSKGQIRRNLKKFGGD